MSELSPNFKSKTIAAGIDEAGRGPLAGPVTAACVLFPVGYHNPEIRDSKKLTANKREKLYREIIDKAERYSIVSVGHRRIERLNIREASRVAMALAAERVFKQLAPEDRQRILFLIDGNTPMCAPYAQETIIKGDAKELSIAAASILAKVTRDRLMLRLDRFYPGYNFAKHKGYPTAEHRQCVKTLGPSPVHRRTFAGVREFCKTPHRSKAISRREFSENRNRALG